MLEASDMETKKKATSILALRTLTETVQEIEDEGMMRGQTKSQALELIIKYGLPIYLKRVPKKFDRIERADDAA